METKTLTQMQYDNYRLIVLDRARSSGIELSNNNLNFIISLLIEKEKELGVLSQSYLNGFFYALFTDEIRHKNNVEKLLKDVGKLS